MQTQMQRTGRCTRPARVRFFKFYGAVRERDGPSKTTDWLSPSVRVPVRSQAAAQQPAARRAVTARSDWGHRPPAQVWRRRHIMFPVGQAMMYECASDVLFFWSGLAKYSTGVELRNVRATVTRFCDGLCGFFHLEPWPLGVPRPRGPPPPQAQARLRLPQARRGFGGAPAVPLCAGHARYKPHGWGGEAEVDSGSHEVVACREPMFVESSGSPVFVPVSDTTHQSQRAKFPMALPLFLCLPPLQGRALRGMSTLTAIFARQRLSGRRLGVHPDPR
eukprot:gene14879-biopygen23141